VITEIHLENFKRFQNLTLKSGALTVLTGANGTGKTSVLHSLLLARQMARRNFIPAFSAQPLGMKREFAVPAPPAAGFLLP